MATEVKRRRGTTSEHSTFTGAVAELTVDLDKDTVVVHDGATTGGFPLLREDANNNSTLKDLSDSLSASASELNILDGATLSTAELNLLDGVTATTSELNRLDGNNSTVQSNIGLKDGSADLDLNSVASQTANTNTDVMDTIAYEFVESRGWGYNTADDRVFYNGAGSIPFWVDLNNAQFNVDTDVDGAFSATSLRTDNGKFHAPTSYQFRNAGDTGFRNVEMAGLTANGLITGSSSVDEKMRLEGDGTSSPFMTFYQGATRRAYLQYVNGDRFHMFNDVTDESFSLLDAGGASLDTDLSISGAYNRSSNQGIELPLNQGSYITGETKGKMYQTDGTGASYPFDMFGRVVIQGRESTPKSRSDVVIAGYDGTNWVENTVFHSSNGVSIGSDSLTSGYRLDINGDVLARNDLQINGTARSNAFDNATWAGNGYRGTDAGDWVVENLRVRHALEVYEFVAKQISSVGGKEILSIANGRIEEIDTVNNTIKVQDVRDQGITSLKQDDLWIIQESDVNNDKVSGGTGAIVRSVIGSVVNDPSTDAGLDGNEIELSVDVGTISDIEENDLIVVYGNSTDSARNAIMYRNVDRSDDNLIMRVQTDVTSFGALTDPNNTRVAFGDLNGYADFGDETFGFFAGDNTSNKVTVDASNGIRFLDGSNNIAARLSGSLFKIGDNINYVEYDASTSSFDAVMDTFTLNAGSGELLIDSNTPKIDIGNGTHTLDGSGSHNVSFSNGILTADDTDVGLAGWTATADRLDSIQSDGKISIRSNTNGVPEIRMEDTNNGEVLFIGNIYDGSSYTGELGIEYYVSPSNIPFVLRASEKRIAGAFFDSTGMWGGNGATSNPATKNDSAIWLNFSTGEIYSDAAADLVWSRNELASFSVDATASSINNEYWKQNVSQSSEGSNSSEAVKIRAMRKKRFSKDVMAFTGVAREESVTGGGSATVERSVEVRATVSSVSGTETATGSIETLFASDKEFDFTVDISSIPDDDLMLIEISLYVDINVINYDSGTYETDGFLREDVVIETTTG